MGEYLWTDGWRGFDAFSFVGLLLKVRRAGSIAGYGIASSTLFFMWADWASFGLLRFLYTLLALLRYKNVAAKIGRRCLLDPSTFIYLFSGWLGIPVPLSDGWMPEAYLEIQAITSLLYVSCMDFLYPFDCRCCFIRSLCSGDWREE